MAPGIEERVTNGHLVRGLLAELKSRGLFDAVRAGVSPEAQAMMDDPPLHIVWVPSQRCEELFERLGQVVGREKVQEIAYACVHDTTGPLLTPLIKTYLKLSGASVASTLKHMSQIVSVLYRGIQIDYAPETERSGYLTMRFPEPISDFNYASWEGAYRFGKDVTGVPSWTIGRFDVSEGGKAGRVRVEW